MTETAPEGKPPLDDIMLAMDVVDTLRHQQLLVERELGAEDRDRIMQQRLREIYSAQGIEVPDHILEQGVAALKEGRFAYEPTPPGIQRWLAGLYVSRGSWGRPVGLLLATVAVLWLLHSLLVSGPAQRAEAALPRQLESQSAQLQELAVGSAARERASALSSEGEYALQREDRDALERTLERMQGLGEELQREYTLRVVSGPGERSGVWRIPDANSRARNYYLIVEAVDDYGQVFEVPIINEEDGESYRVKQWGLRVEQDQFERLAADKADDGIIQNNQVGVKKRGYLVPQYSIPTSGGAITRW